MNTIQRRTIAGSFTRASKKAMTVSLMAIVAVLLPSPQTAAAAGSPAPSFTAQAAMVPMSANAFGPPIKERIKERLNKRKEQRQERKELRKEGGTIRERLNLRKEQRLERQELRKEHATEFRAEMTELREKIRNKVLASFGKAIVPIVKRSMRSAEQLPKKAQALLQTVASARAAADADMVAHLETLHARLNAKGMPKKVADTVIGPLVHGQITQDQAWTRLGDLTGPQGLAALSSQAEAHGYYTFTIAAVAGAGAVVGAEVTSPTIPGVAFGAFRDVQDEYNFALFWTGGGKVGLTYEAAAGIQLGLWKRTPDELMGPYVGLSGGGGEGFAMNVAVAFDPEGLNKQNRSLFMDDPDLWIERFTQGWTLSGTASAGLPVEAVLTAGGTVTVIPGKVIDRIKERRAQ